MKSLEDGSSAVRKWQQEAGIAQEANPLPVSICSTAQMRCCRRDVVGECKVYALWGGFVNGLQVKGDLRKQEGIPGD